MTDVPPIAAPADLFDLTGKVAIVTGGSGARPGDERGPAPGRAPTS